MPIHKHLVRVVAWIVVGFSVPLVYAQDNLRAPNLQSGTITNVGDSWVTINLPGQYQSPVVVAVPQYNDDQPPAVVRIQNRNSNNFQVRVQNPSGEELSGYTVHYIVVEEGVYSRETHGVTMEAVIIEADETDHAGDWTGIPVDYVNTYNDPVVIGQVMSSRDARWSVFWSRGLLSSAPPGITLRVGKHVGEDEEIVRTAEEVGYMVWEAGIGTINGYEYQAFVGEDVVNGMGDNPPYRYAYDLEKADAAIVSATGMDGVNGGWPVLWSDNGLNQAEVRLAIDEDQINDSERSHTTEQAATVVLRQLPIPPRIDRFDPISGGPGSTVNLFGANFSVIEGVAFNGVSATEFTVLSESQILVQVPEEAESGVIQVFNAIGKAETAGAFEVVPNASLGGIWPVRGEEGATVVLLGSGMQSVERVEFADGQPAEYTILSNIEVNAIVPQGAITGPIHVFDANGNELESREVFTVTITEARKGVNLCRLTEAVHLQSSTDESFSVPEKACDGILEGTFAGESYAATTIETEAWWEVDLGGVYEIESIRVWNRTDCCQELLSNVFAFVSDSPFISRSAATTLADASVSAFFIGTAGASWDTPVLRTGRYVRLQHSGEGALNLSEVDIIAGGDGALNVGTEDPASSLRRMELFTAYPSPAIHRTSLSYRLGQATSVRLVVYDVLGREVQTLVDTHQGTGEYEVPFDTSTLSRGIYFYRLFGNQESLSKALLLID